MNATSERATVVARSLCLAGFQKVKRLFRRLIDFSRRLNRLGGYALGRRLRRSGSGCRALAARVALADARRFAAQLAQVVELGAAHAATAHQIDVINHRRVKREDAL